MALEADRLIWMDAPVSRALFEVCLGLLSAVCGFASFRTTKPAAPLPDWVKRLGAMPSDSERFASRRDTGRAFMAVGVLLIIAGAIQLIAWWFHRP